VAGIGEEWLFRGVLQTSLGDRIGVGPSLGLTSIVFGALHAVTPLYAALASLASLYFGYLYIGVSSSANDLNNLAMPMVCHGFYDVLALLYAHYTVTNMSPQEQYDLATWEPSSPPEK
jgi:membrane protease YdiL (CAAX protease family)